MLATNGIATVGMSVTRLAGTLSGRLDVNDPARQGALVASCRADDHQFVMTR